MRLPGAFIGKPPQGSVFNRGHRLAPDAGCWLFGENAKTITNLVNGVKGTPTAGVTWAPNQLGTGFNTNPGAALTSDRVNTNDLASFNAAAGSVAWALVPGFAFNDGSGHYIWGEDNNSGANAATPEFVCLKFSDSHLYAGWNNATADARVNVTLSAALWTVGLLQHFVLTWGPNGSVLYRNGVSIGTKATVPTITTNANAFCWGHTSANVTAAVGAGLTNFSYGYIYRRCLTPTDVVSLFNAPFQMFVAPRPWSVRGATSSLSIAQEMAVLQSLQAGAMTGMSYQ